MVLLGVNGCDTSPVIPREHSDRGNLLAGYALSTLSLVGFEEILRYTQNDRV